MGYSNGPPWTHGFNAKIGLEKYAPSTEILAKRSQNTQVWFGDPDFGTSD